MVMVGGQEGRWVGGWKDYTGMWWKGRVGGMSGWCVSLSVCVIVRVCIMCMYMCVWSKKQKRESNNINDFQEFAKIYLISHDQ